MPLKRKHVFRVLELNAGNSPVFRSLKKRHPGKRIEYHGVESYKRETRNPFPKGMHFMHNEDFYTSEHAVPNAFHEIHFHMQKHYPALLDNLDQLYRLLKPGGVVYAFEDSNPYGISARLRETSTFFSHANEETRLVGGKKPPITRESKERARKHNAELAVKIRAKGFEILRVSVGDMQKDAKLETPPGVFPEGTRVPERTPVKFFKQVMDYEYPGQFVILRKPKKKKS